LGVNSRRRTSFQALRLWLLTRLLDDSVRTGVWPDSVQVSGGKLSMRLPTL